jgi:hypothetical protein
MSVENTLAYYDTATMTVIKKSYVKGHCMKRKWMELMSQNEII